MDQQQTAAPKDQEQPGDGLFFSDEMCEAAWEAYCEARDNGEDEPVKVMRAAMEAAFNDVPVTNYGIGLALAFFDLVICVKETPHAAKAGVYRKGGEPQAFDSLDHHIQVTWGHKPTRWVNSVQVSKLPPPGEPA